MTDPDDQQSFNAVLGMRAIKEAKGILHHASVTSLDRETAIAAICEIVFLAGKIHGIKVAFDKVEEVIGQ